MLWEKKFVYSTSNLISLSPIARGKVGGEIGGIYTMAEKGDTLVVDVCKMTKHFNCGVVVRYRDSENLAIELLGRRDLSVKLN